MDDLISRQAAIDAIEHRLAEPAYQHTGEDWYAGMNCAESELYDLQSAQPERKTGKWVLFGKGIYWQCDQCNWSTDFDIPRKFCPQCGARMEIEGCST